MIRILLAALLVLFSIPAFTLDLCVVINSGFDVQLVNSNSQLYPDKFFQIRGIANQGFDYYVNSDVIVKSSIGEIGKGFLDIKFSYYPKTFITNMPQQYFNIVESYVEFSSEYFLLRFGKHFMHWGDGVCFNPVDIVNLRKDPLSYTGYDQGKPGIDLTVPIGDFSSFSVLSIVDSTLTSNITDLPLILQYGVFIDMFDGFLFADIQKNYKPVYGGNVDYTFSIGSHSSLKLYSQLKYKQDSYRKHAVVTNGVPYLENMPNDFFMAAAVGGSFSYSFTETTLIDGIIVSLEYYYDSENWSKKDYQNFLMLVNNYSESSDLYGYWAAINEQESLRNSNHYLYTRLTFQGLINKDFGFSCQVILNIEDLSSVIMPSAAYQLNTETRVSVNAQFYNGKDDSEFGSQSQIYSVNVNLMVAF